MKTYGKQRVRDSLQRLSKRINYRWRLQEALRVKRKTKYVRIFVLQDTAVGWHIALTIERNGQLHWPCGEIAPEDLSMAHAAARTVKEKTGLDIPPGDLVRIGSELWHVEGDPTDTLCESFIHIAPGTGRPEDLPGLQAEERGKWLVLEQWWNELQREKQQEEIKRCGPLQVMDVAASRGERGALFRVRTRNKNGKSDPSINVFRSHEVGAPLKRILKYNAKEFCQTSDVAQPRLQGTPDAWSELRNLKTDKMAQPGEELTSVLWDMIDTIRRSARKW